MVTRFELVLEQEKYTFRLRANDGQVLLEGLASPSKIVMQNEILHVRTAVRDKNKLVPHHDEDRHFVVVKDADGSVLARSPRCATERDLSKLMAHLLATRSWAPIVDLTKRPAHAT